MIAECNHRSVYDYLQVLLHEWLIQYFRLFGRDSEVNSVTINRYRI